MTDIMKYLKYKKKYINLKKQMYGGDDKTIVVNMMWIYNKKTDNMYIFPTIHKEFDVIETINMWLEKNYKIYFWYDSFTVDKVQIENTNELFRDKNVSLFDIRTIMENYSAIFDCLIYTIVDFCRLVILQYLINNEPHDYYIYTDLLIKPIDMHDLTSNESLNNFKILLCAKKKGELNSEPYENNFIAITNNEIIKRNLNNFINVIYNHIIINKKLVGSRGINCNKYDAGHRQMFFEILPILIFIQIEEIFYNKSTPFDNIYNILDDRHSVISKFKNVKTSVLPFKTRQFSFADHARIKRIKEQKPVDEDAIQKILDNVSIVDVYYVYPVIDMDRPLISGKY